MECGKCSTNMTTRDLFDLSEALQCISVNCLHLLEVGELSRRHHGKKGGGDLTKCVHGQVKGLDRPSAVSSPTIYAYCRPKSLQP